MKISKSIFAVMLMAFAGSAFAADVTFENELETQVVKIRNADDKKTLFAGFKNKARLEVESEYADGFVELEMSFDENDDHDLRFYWSDIDYGIVGHAFSWLDVGFHDDMPTAGGYLPIYDDDMAGGRLGSTGFTLCFMPIEGLRITGTIPFGEEDDANIMNNFDEYKFLFGFGADYCFKDMITIGANARNIIDDDKRSIGFFAAFTPKENITIRAGYANTQYENGFDDLNLECDKGIIGKETNYINAAVEFEAEKFSIAAEGICNVSADETEYDFYAAATFSYNLTEKLALGVKALTLVDFTEDGLKPVFGTNLGAEFAINEKHTVGAGVNFENCDGDVFVSFPITWKLALSNK